MRLKTQSFDALLRVYKYLAIALMMINTCATIYLPKWIAPHVNVTEHTIRVITFVASLFVSGRALTHCNNVWVQTHDEMLDEDAYNVQQTLANIGIVNMDELDDIIKVLNDIKNAKNPKEKKTEEDKHE